MRFLGHFFLALCIGATLASCGDDQDTEPLSKAEYQRALIDVYADSGPADLLYNSLVYDKLPQEQCTQKARAFSELVTKLVDRVAALQPPAKAAQAQDDFVAGARGSADELDEIADQVAAGEVPCGPKLASGINSISTSRADDAVSELQSLGYITFGY